MSRINATGSGGFGGPDFAGVLHLTVCLDDGEKWSFTGAAAGISTPAAFSFDLSGYLNPSDAGGLTAFNLAIAGAGPAGGVVIQFGEIEDVGNFTGSVTGGGAGALVGAGHWSKD